MGYTEDTLGSDEEITYVAKLDPWAYFVMGVGGTILIGGVIGLAFEQLIVGIVFGAILTSIVVVASYLIDKFMIEMRITNKRVIYKRGLIFRNTDELSRSAVEGAQLNQSLLGRIFGYGNIVVTGRGVEKVIFKNVDEPLQLRKAIIDGASTE